MTEYALIFSKINILIFVFAIFLGILSNIKINSKYIFIMGIFFVITFSFIGFITLPHESDDLSRYFYWVNAMKGNSIDFAFKHSPFANTPISNMLIYIVSVIGNEHFLPAIVVMVESSCIMYIILCEKKRKDVNSRIISLYIIICIGVVGLYMCVSGIRYNLSISIAGVIIYNDIIKNKKGIGTIIGYISLPLIHLNAITIVIIRILYQIKFIKKNQLIFIAIPGIFIIIKPILSKLSIPIIVNIVEKVNMYQGVILAGESFKRNIGYMLFIFVNYAVIMSIEKVNKNYNNNEVKIMPNELNYVYFVKNYILFIVGSYLIIPEIFYRGTAIIAILSLPNLILFNRTVKYKLINYIVLLSYVISLTIFYIYEFILFYNKWMINV